MDNATNIIKEQIEKLECDLKQYKPTCWEDEDQEKCSIMESIIDLNKCLHYLTNIKVNEQYNIQHDK